VIAILDAAASPRAAAEALRQAGFDAPRVAAALRAGRTYAPAQPGMHVLDIHAGDRATQCEVLVPQGYDPARPWPLVVALHGLGGSGAQMTRIMGGLVDTEHVLLACPTATNPPDVSPFIRNTVWAVSPRKQWWSYSHVSFPLAALEAVKKRFNVDEDRVVLTGYSMGGFGSWNISLRHWDRFAAVAPMAGGLEPQEGVTGPDAGLRRLLSNGTHLPFFVVHGAQDRLVPADFSRWNVSALEERGASVQYHEVEKAGHILPRAEFEKLQPAFAAFVSGHRRAPLPRAVHHVALSPTHGFAGWLRIDAASGPADLRARFPEAPDREPIEVTASGVSELTVFIPEAWTPHGTLPQIRVNGRLVSARPADPLEALADSWMARADRTRTFARRLTLRVPNADADNDF